MITASAAARDTTGRSHSSKVVIFGEAMAELSDINGDRCRFGVAGDTFNTAVYLARAGVDVSYVTALGSDPVSDVILARIVDEGIDAGMVLRAAGAPGIYAIAVDAAGERSFTYWRANSVAREFFKTMGADALLERACQADVLYISGITLSLFSQEEVARLRAVASVLRNRGGIVAFDTNFRSGGWPSVDTARKTIMHFAPLVTLALPTFGDDALLFGDASAEATARRWHGWGARETVVKQGADGALVNGREWVAPPRLVKPLDTTGAGDSFNGAYIAARLNGDDPRRAAISGHVLAAQVIMSPGAILPQPVAN